MTARTRKVDATPGLHAWLSSALFVLAALFVPSAPAAAAGRAAIARDGRAPTIEFAASESEAALRARKYQVARMEEWRVDESPRFDLVVRFALVDGADDPQFGAIRQEGFLLRSVALETHRELVVLAIDGAGAM